MTKRFALSLTFIMRFKATQKWPIYYVVFRTTVRTSSSRIRYPYLNPLPPPPPNTHTVPGGCNTTQAKTQRHLWGRYGYFLELNNGTDFFFFTLGITYVSKAHSFTSKGQSACEITVTSHCCIHFSHNI